MTLILLFSAVSLAFTIYAVFSETAEKAHWEVLETKEVA